MIRTEHFSFVPYGVLHNEDVRAYIHYNIQELGNVDMLSLYTKHMMDNFGNLKPDFKSLQDKGFIQFVHFSAFDEPEWMRYVLSLIHNEFIWLDIPHKIMKQSIQAVTCLNDTNEILGLRHVKNKSVMEVIGSKHDNRSMTISDIVKFDVR